MRGALVAWPGSGRCHWHGLRAGPCCHREPVPSGLENGNVSANCSDSVVGRLREPRGPGLDKCVFLNNLETRAWLLPLHPGFFHRVFLSSAFLVYQHGVTHLALLDVNVCIVVALTAECRGCFSSTVPKLQLCAPLCLCRAGKPRRRHITAASKNKWWFTLRNCMRIKLFSGK